MKQIRLLIGRLAAGCVALALVSNLAAQTAQEGFAKVVNIKGAARYMTAGSSVWQPVKVGAMLKPGTVIQTAADSYVDVVLNDREAAATGLASPDAASSASATSATTEDMAQYQPKARQDAIRVFENSVLGIDKLTVTETGADTVTETQLDLKAGRIFGTVKKLSAASKYEVKLPNGVAGIRGTIYLIGANGVVSVLSGSVVISYVGPSGSVVTQVVKAGQQFDPNVTDPAQQVGPLPPAVVKFIVPLAKIFDRFLPEPRPTTYVGADKTVYSVTPTK